MINQSNNILIKFEFENENYAFFSNDLEETVVLENITKLPKTPLCIYGIANHRGKIITLVNLPFIFNKAVPKVFYVSILQKSLSHIGVIINRDIEILMIDTLQIRPVSKERMDLAGSAILSGELILDNLIYLISINKLYSYITEEVQKYLRKEYEIYA